MNSSVHFNMQAIRNLPKSSLLTCILLANFITLTVKPGPLELREPDSQGYSVAYRKEMWKAAYDGLDRHRDEAIRERTKALLMLRLPLLARGAATAAAIANGDPVAKAVVAVQSESQIRIAELISLFSKQPLKNLVATRFIAEDVRVVTVDEFESVSLRQGMLIVRFPNSASTHQELLHRISAHVIEIYAEIVPVVFVLDERIAGPEISVPQDDRRFRTVYFRYDKVTEAFEKNDPERIQSFFLGVWAALSGL